MEESVKQLADQSFALGAKLEELSDDLSALSNDFRQAKLQIEDLFSKNPNREESQSAEKLSKKDLLSLLDTISERWETLNHSLITLQERVANQHDIVEHEIDNQQEDTEEYALLEDTLDDLSLVYAELTEVLDDMDTLLTAITELRRALDELKP
ncbi:hypothetical protein [Coprothermobacter platensis]|uniref:hypothetical protein n=1 Tax=Coprothermobacter platensis TaxID=108819 RepID=UPI00035C8F1F|nr:hypothetical protein [Coprothermobacter platensis]